jgi:hypothetical protein
MSDQTVLNDLCCSCLNSFEIAPAQDIHVAYLVDGVRCSYLGLQEIALDDIAGSTVDKGHTHLLDILFMRLSEITNCRLEGVETPPDVVYKIGRRYFIAGDGRSLAAAREAGQAFIQAEVWEP